VNSAHAIFRMVHLAHCTVCSKTTGRGVELVLLLNKTHVPVFDKHDFPHKNERCNDVLTPQHATRVGRSDTNKRTPNGRYRSPPQPAAAFAIPRCSRTP
jgi:hypothetical protein